MAQPVTTALFWGEDEFLLRQAALQFLEEGAAKATEVDAREWQGGEISDLSTPSLWGERRALLVIGCQGVPEAGAPGLRSYVQAAAPEGVCLLTLVSRGKSAPPLAQSVPAGRGARRNR